MLKAIPPNASGKTKKRKENLIKKENLSTGQKIIVIIHP